MCWPMGRSKGNPAGVRQLPTACQTLASATLPVSGKGVAREWLKTKELFFFWVPDQTWGLGKPSWVSCFPKPLPPSPSTMSLPTEACPFLEAGEGQRQVQSRGGRPGCIPCGLLARNFVYSIGPVTGTARAVSSVRAGFLLCSLN